MNIDQSSTPLTERALKKQMHQILFHMPGTENTIIVLQIHVFPLEKILGVQSVI
jgi:hypothetical protein